MHMLGIIAFTEPLAHLGTYVRNGGGRHYAIVDSLLLTPACLLFLYHKAHCAFLTNDIVAK